MLVRPVDFLGLPAGTTQRVMVRIYTEQTDIPFRVTVFDGEDRLVDTYNVATLGTGWAADREFPPSPSATEVPDLGARLAGSEFRVHVEPLAAGVPYYAFVSVTTNTTQDVTIVTPH